MSNKEKVCFPSENKQGACPGVLTGDTSKSSMGLVVLQEWWGMNQVIIDEAADISERYGGPLVRWPIRDMESYSFY